VIEATNKNYVIKPIEQSKQTAGGIFIQHSDESQLATIISAGPDVDHPIPVGSVIALNWNSTAKLQIGGEPVFFIHQDGILGVVKSDA